MPTPGLRRALALALLVLFAGQAAAAGIDALLYHNDPGPSHAASHWDPSGGCQSHAERCALRAAPVGPRFVAPSLRTIAPVHAAIHRVYLGAAARLHSFADSSLQARAPPVVL